MEREREKKGQESKTLLVMSDRKGERIKEIKEEVGEREKGREHDRNTSKREIERENNIFQNKRNNNSFTMRGRSTLQLCILANVRLAP